MGWYTQLSFIPYSPSRKALLAQAEWLLHELVKDRHHEFPCDCGACIYSEYQKRKKGEGRSFSKRTFFVFFLWMGYFRVTLYDPQLSGARLSKRAEEKRGDILMKEGLWSYKQIRELGRKRRLKIVKRLDKTLSTNVFYEEVKSITRERTRKMIQTLAENERDRLGREFLRGILQKKCFYTYYARAASRDLYDIVTETRRSLSGPRPNN